MGVLAMGKVIAMPPELMRMAEEAVWGNWAQESRGPTCLDCGRCEMMDGAMDEEVKAVLGYRIGFCLENFAWVTDQCTVDELGNDGDDGCFRWW